MDMLEYSWKLDVPIPGFGLDSLFHGTLSSR